MFQINQENFLPEKLHNRRETRKGEKQTACYQSIVLALPTFTSLTLRSNWLIDDALFWHVRLEQNIRQVSCCFDDAVREAFPLFLNVPEVKEKQKKCLNLESKRKDFLGFVPTRLGKSLIY